MTTIVFVFFLSCDFWRWFSSSHLCITPDLSCHSDTCLLLATRLFMTLTPWPVTCNWRRTDWRTAQRRTRSTPARVPPPPPPLLPVWRRWSSSPMTASLKHLRPSSPSPSTPLQYWPCWRSPTLPCHHRDTLHKEPRITTLRICLIRL